MESRLPRCTIVSDASIAEMPSVSTEKKLSTAMLKTMDFESGRIKELKSERLHIQQKTFTKWINSFLLKTEIQVIH